MDYNAVLSISAAGMEVERRRVEIAALNLANANTVAGPGESLYQPMRVAVRTAPVAGNTFDRLFDHGVNMRPAAHVESAVDPVRYVYQPGHPLADAKGFVAHPAVDTASEMVTIMGALRSYEANIAAMTAARTMALKALEIGGGA